MIDLDTHVVVWLYAGRLRLLSKRARRLIEANEVLISPAVILEMDLLQEIGRIAERGEPIFRDLQSRIGLRLCDLPFDQVVRAASKETWTRDPFDRLIVGQAAAGGRKLVSRDEAIRRHFPGSAW